MKKERIFWGVFLILGAVLVIANALGLVEGIGFWTVLGTVAFAAILVKSVFSLSFAGIFFSAAFLIILYDEQLQLEAITPWPVLGAALLLSIGFHMLFHKKSHVKCHSSHTEFDEIINEADGDTIQLSVSFGSAIKYVNSDDFRKAELDCSFGALKVYFDNAMIQQEKALVNMDISFGGVELYIPKTWNVENRVHASLGAIEEKNHNTPDGNHTLVLTGSVSLSGVTIIYS